MDLLYIEKALVEKDGKLVTLDDKGKEVYSWITLTPLITIRFDNIVIKNTFNIKANSPDAMTRSLSAYFSKEPKPNYSVYYLDYNNKIVDVSSVSCDISVIDESTESKSRPNACFRGYASGCNLEIYIENAILASLCDCLAKNERATLEVKLRVKALMPITIDGVSLLDREEGIVMADESLHDIDVESLQVVTENNPLINFLTEPVEEEIADQIGFNNLQLQKNHYQALTFRQLLFFSRSIKQVKLILAVIIVLLVIDTVL